MESPSSDDDGKKNMRGMPNLASQTDENVEKDVGKTPLLSQNDVVVGNTHYLNSLIRSRGNQ